MRTKQKSISLTLSVQFKLHRRMEVGGIVAQFVTEACLCISWWRT